MSGGDGAGEVGGVGVSGVVEQGGEQCAGGEDGGGGPVGGGVAVDGGVLLEGWGDGGVRIGYARVSTRAQEHQAQLDALAAAHCREIIVETASTRGDRPELREALGQLQAGDTLVIYKPDRVARSMKELLVLLEDQLHARGINLQILTGICAGIHRPDGATIADKMLFMVAAMAAEMERDLIRKRRLARRGQQCLLEPAGPDRPQRSRRSAAAPPLA